MLMYVKWIMLLLAFALPVATGWGDDYLRENYVKDEYFRMLMTRVVFIVNIVWLVLLYIVWLVAGLRTAANKYRFAVIFHFIQAPVFCILWIVFVFVAAFYLNGMKGVQ